MNIPELINTAIDFNGDLVAVEEKILEKLGESIFYAIKRAEKENAFVAVACLQELSVKYPRKIKNNLTKEEINESIEIKIEVDESVKPVLKNAVFGKAKKIGNALTETKTKGVFLIRNNEVEKFIASTRRMDGFIVDVTETKVSVKNGKKIINAVKK